MFWSKEIDSVRKINVDKDITFKSDYKGNTYYLYSLDYKETFDMLEGTGKKEIHFHFEGIEINSGGEGRHIQITGSKPDFREFAAELLKRNIDANIISESPLTWRDSLNMKKMLEKEGHRWGDEN